MKVEEGRIIKENPLRILGVFSDTPKKVIVANLGKLRAFAKTGKTLSFESDFTSLLGPVKRTSESIEKANNDISLPKDKLQAGMFWFMQHTDNDKAALDCLKSGDANEAMAIIQKKGNYSGVVNMAVLALILKRWDIALYSYAFLLESPQRRGALIKSFTDTEDYFSEEDLVEFISNKLIRDFPCAHWLEQIQHENVELGEKTYPFKSRFADSKLLNKITSECTLSIKNAIDEVLNKASSVSRNDAKTNLSMAASVEEKCKPLLKELRIALGKDNKTYIEYADNIANQILDNCIDYYTHDADNPKRAQNVIKYTRYAYRTAESKTTKERAKKNLDILNKVLEDSIPESIRTEYNNIDKQVMFIKQNPNAIDYCKKLSAIIPYCCNQLDIIEQKLGSNNKHFLSISTNFGLFADQAIIKKVSEFLTKIGYVENKNYSKDIVMQGHKLLQWACLNYKVIEESITFHTELKENDPFMNYLHNRDYVQKVFNNFYKQLKAFQNSNTTISYTTFQKNNVGTIQNKKENIETSQIKPTAPPKKVDNSSLIYVICLAGFILVMVLLFSNKGTSYHSKPEQNTVEQTNVPSSDENTNNESVSSNYSNDNTYSSNSNSNYDNVLNQDLSNYHFDSDNNNTKDSYSTIQYHTGDRPYQSTYGKGSYDSHTQNSLLIKNGSSTDAVVFLERINGKKVRHVYIERGQNFTMTKIPGGEYIIKVMQGTDWNPEKDNGSGNPKGGFMYSCSISKSESYDAFDYPYPSSGQYGQYEVTLYKVQNGNMQTETINESDLF